MRYYYSLLVLILSLLCALSACQDDDNNSRPEVDPLPNNDRQALIALYNATNGEAWNRKENWNTDAPLSQWEGVEVDTLYGAERVTQLTLDENNLEGPLPDAFFNLPYLEVLHLEFNKFTEALPEAIGNLTNLRELYLQASNLIGELPKGLAKLEKVEVIYLQGNNLVGSVPAEYATLMDRMPSTYLMGEENLIRGTSLVLRANGLSGKLPDAITQHPRWDEFWLNIMEQKTGQTEVPSIPIYNYDKIVLEDVDGKQFNLKERVAKKELTVLYFWSSDSDFTEELTTHNSMMQYVLSTYPDKIDVIGMNWQGLYPKYTDEKAQEKKAFAQAHNMDWTQVAGNRPGNWISYLTNAYGYPQIYILNSKGEVIFAAGIGINNDNEFIDFVEKKLGTVNSYESTDYSLDGIWKKVKSATAGNHPGGVNFIITGDGFTDKDMAQGGKFDRLVNETIEGLFSTEPMKSYQDYVNIYTLRAVSKHEGIGNGRETAYSSYFDGGVLIRGDNNKVYDRITEIDDLDEVGAMNFQCIMILNTPRYGGTCHSFYFNGTDDKFSIAYCPYINNKKTSYIPVMLHESVGHGFGFLADEYRYYAQSILQEYVEIIKSSQSRNSYLNLATDKDNLPWRHLVGQPLYPKVGAYEGGFQFQKGVWRSEETSCMEDTYAYPYFNAASRELIVKNIKRLAGEEYSLDDFIIRDKAGRDEAASMQTRGFAEPVKKYPPLPPPVIREMSKLHKNN